MKQYYADVIVDISAGALDKSFQYKIPESLRESVQEGSRVIVPFGNGNRKVAAYVIAVSDVPKLPEAKLKEIEACPEKYIGAEERMIDLARWIRRTYGSTFIQALKTVVPVKEKRKQRKKRTDNPAVPAGGKPRSASEGMQETGTASEPETNTDARIPALNAQQQAVYDGIRAEFAKEKPRPCLLRGITGSGKTHVYMHLIRDAVEAGQQAILLIPEISLTWQTVSRFTAVFGERIAVLHSRLSDGEKSTLMERVKNKEVDLVIGPRSALFTPFENLGLIIVDEEHDSSYVSEMTPRYHAVETAAARAQLEGAKLLLGSATPSLESRYFCEAGSYALFELDARFAGASPPEIRVIDMREELRRGHKSIISRELEDEIALRLDRGEQSILFLNRRGHTGFFTCRSCGNVIKCPHCDVALTYHSDGRLMCHYCGFSSPMVETCPTCGSPYIGGLRAGTQQVEGNLKKIFPAARIVRMDRDTTGTKHAHETILKEFAEGGADILIGTQMIVKGHDFPNVTLVGAILADTSLYVQDYRAAERSYQLLVQAAGRAGRGEKGGLGLIQTYQPEHYAVLAACRQDYEAFYKEEIENRRILGYPPVRSLLAIHGSAPDEAKLQNAMLHIRKRLEEIRPADVVILGPVPEAVARVQDQYRMVLYLRNAGLQELIRLRQYVERYISINSGFDEILIQFALND